MLQTQTYWHKHIHLPRKSIKVIKSLNKKRRKYRNKMKRIWKNILGTTTETRGEVSTSKNTHTKIIIILAGGQKYEMEKKLQPN